MASLDGVVAEWDNDPVVRQRIRENRKLFVPAPFMEKPQAKVECGEHNYEVLKPLAKRLKSDDGTVGMHTVPHIQHQIFSSDISENVLIFQDRTILVIGKRIFPLTVLSNMPWHALCF